MTNSSLSVPEIKNACIRTLSTILSLCLYNFKARHLRCVFLLGGCVYIAMQYIHTGGCVYIAMQYIHTLLSSESE